MQLHKCTLVISGTTSDHDFSEPHREVRRSSAHSLAFQKLRDCAIENICKVGMYNRQLRYWKIANPRFLFAWNSIKMRCSNTAYFDYYLDYPDIGLKTY